MRRQARLFAIAEHLRARRTGVTTGELAEKFNVSPRTLFRDLASLRDASLPIVADRGRGGGVALDRGYSLPPVNFNAREAALLVMLGKFAAEMRLLPFIDTLNGALDKVRGALDTSAQRELIGHMKSLRFVGVPGHKVSPRIRRVIEEAWFEQQPIALRYLRADHSTSARTVIVRGLTMERSQTEVECEDVETKERRSYRLDRIESAKPIR
jgi:predicted DNA-binding transcriptional regulator YafY